MYKSYITYVGLLLQGRTGGLGVLWNQLVRVDYSTPY